MHLFGRPDIGDECHDAAVAPSGDRIARLFTYLAAHAVFRTFAVFELSAHANPFVMIFIVNLFCAMQHEVLSVTFEVTLCGLKHIRVLYSSILKNSKGGLCGRPCNVKTGSESED